jgi:hypothetical protein
MVGDVEAPILQPTSAPSESHLFAFLEQNISGGHFDTDTDDE